MKRMVLAAALALLVLLVVAGPAGAYVYWAGPSGIGRAGLDGTGVDGRFIAGVKPTAIALGGRYIYWTDVAAGTIGRAYVDGTAVDRRFITGVTNPLGLAVDSAHIYWTVATRTGGIGRADIDGTHVDQSLITGAEHPTELTVDRNYIYWTEPNAGDGYTTARLGRANLDGSGVNTSFITGQSLPEGVSVDSHHIYWGNNGIGSVGRANLNGTQVNEKFIVASDAIGVAVDSGHLYFTNGGVWIGRADLVGGHIARKFITGVPSAGMLAVDARGPVGAPPRHLGDFLSPDREVWCLMNGGEQDVFCAAGGLGRGPERSAYVRRDGKVGLCHVRVRSFSQECYQNWDSHAPILRYGQRSLVNGFICSSARDGITCVLDSGPKQGVGFRINRRQAVRVGSRA